jgi:glucan biosynthesis protein C
LRWAPRTIHAVEQSVSRGMEGMGILLVPIVVLGTYRLLLMEKFPETHAFFDDWFNHATSFTMFAFGFLFAKSDAVWNTIARWRWIALTLAAGIFGCFLLRSIIGPVAAPARDGSASWWGWVAYWTYGYAVYKWCAIVAVLGFGRRWLAHDSAARRYFTEAVFPYYIVHQTAIIATAHWLKPAGLPAWLEASLVIAATVVACAGTYEIVRRVGWLRPWFGMKRLPLARREPAPTRLAVREDG